MGQLPPKSFNPPAPYGSSQAANVIVPPQQTQQPMQQQPNFKNGPMTAQPQPFNPLRFFGLFLLLFAIYAHATTPVTGSMKDLSTAVVNKGSFVRFWLRGCAGNQPRVTGIGVLVPTQGGTWYKDFPSTNAFGLITGTLYSTRDSAGTGNGEIECGGSYTAVWYGMQVFTNGKGGPEIPVHAKNGITLDISNVTPLQVTPVGTAPSTPVMSIRVKGATVPDPNLVEGPNVSLNVSGSDVTVSSSGGSGGGGGTPSGPVNSVQGNLAGGFYGIAGLWFSAPSGSNPANLNADVVNGVITVTSDYNFSACASGCTYVISGATTLSAGSNTVTITPFPVGVNGSVTLHYLAIVPAAGDTSPTDYVLVAGGTGTSGASSGTLTFTSHFAYIAGYKIQSASTGIQEAANTMSVPGGTLLLVPHASYYCNAPVYLQNNNFTVDGQWARVYHNSFNSCFVFSGTGAFGGVGAGESNDVSHIDFRPTSAPWSVQPTGSLDGTGGTATLTIPTCPNNFYAAIPNQLLWMNGTAGGYPTTVYGTGEYVLVTGGTCTPGATNGTIAVSNATPNSTVISQHDHGYTLSSNVGPYIEDGLATNGHFHDLRFSSNSVGMGQGHRFMVNNDQHCTIDNIDASNGYNVRVDADFQGAGVYFPGGANMSAICWVHHLNQSSGGLCIDWWSGNDVFFESGICQNYAVAGVRVGHKRGGFGQFYVGRDVHFEEGGITSPWSVNLGVPYIIAVAGGQVTSDNIFYAPQPFSTAVGYAWPDFSQIGGASTIQYYYLVAHQNISAKTGVTAGCDSGGDCKSVPVLLGIAINNDPSVNNVTLHWWGWGMGPGTVANNAYLPSSYDLIAQTVNNPNPGVVSPQTPVGTGNYLIASGLLPSSICDIHNICTYTDTTAPGSRTSYSVNATEGKTFAPITSLMPGTIAITGNGGSGSVVSYRGYGYYSGTQACVNTMKPWFDYESGAGNNILAADFTSRNSYACPGMPSPVGRLANRKSCYQVSSGGAGSPANTAQCVTAQGGFTTIAAGQTTVTVLTTEVELLSRVLITEDTTQGTMLGITCNSTLGRHYAITQIVPGVSFTITTDAAPSSTQACLDFDIRN